MTIDRKRDPPPKPPGDTLTLDPDFDDLDQADAEFHRLALA